MGNSRTDRRRRNGGVALMVRIVTRADPLSSLSFDFSWIVERRIALAERGRFSWWEYEKNMKSGKSEEGGKKLLTNRLGEG